MTNSIQRLEESIADKIKNYQKHLNYWEFDDKHVDIRRSENPYVRSTISGMSFF